MIAVVVMALMGLGGQPVTNAAAPPPLADPPSKSALQIAQDTYERLEQLYAESCSDRAYGAYDDLCDQLNRQVHQSRVDLDQLERADEASTKTPRQR